MTTLSGDISLTQNITSMLPEWWQTANEWLDEQCDHYYGCYWYYLCAVYGIISIVAMIQLIRIQVRAPDFGWTTQKIFHFMNCIVCALRAISFGFYTYYPNLKEELNNNIINLIAFDLPGLLFFTTYTLLVLFWAEIYHQAANVETQMLRPWFLRINIFIYVIQIILWVWTVFSESLARYASATWLTAVSLGAVSGFLIYGCRLFMMLRKFPIESRGRKRKLTEVGCITFICTLCFTIRAVLLVLFFVDTDDFDLNLLDDDLLNIIFYVAVEIFPAISVLAILHRLPPKRSRSMTTNTAPRAPPYNPDDSQDAS